MKFYNYIIILLLSSFFYSQNTELKISNIIVYGNIEISDQDIVNFSGISPDSYINAIEIQNAIKRLWLLNRFNNIQIDLEEYYGTTDLIITVEEFPILNEVKFKGDYFKFKLFKFKKSKSDLEKISMLESGGVLSGQKINSAIRLIKKDFIGSDFHDIKISYTIEVSESDNNKRNILFDIGEGSKSKIEDVQIILNGKELKHIGPFESIKSKFQNEHKITKNDILTNLSDIKTWKWYLPWRGSYNEEKLEDMVQNLNSYYRSKGYLDFNIIDYQVINSKKTSLVLKIESGYEYNINSISFSGNYIFSDSTITSQFNMTSGDYFNGLAFEMSNMNLNNLYREKGYLFSQISPSIVPISDNLLDIHFNIIEKSIVRVNKVIIRGNETTLENVIRRDIEVFPEQIFSQSSIMESYRKLAMLNFFESVQPDIKPIEGENEVDVVFEVTEKGSGTLNFTAGYSGIYGFTGGGGFSFPNFLGTGQNLSFNYQRGISGQQNSIPTGEINASQTNQQFSMGYVEPRLFNTHNLIGISANYTERGRSNTQPFDSKIIGGGLRFGRRFNWPDNFFKGSWMLSGSRREYFSSSKEDLILYYSSSIEEYIIHRDDKYIFPTSGLKVTQNIKRDNRNHPEFPTQGSQFSWNLILSGSFLGGNEDYLKNEIGLKSYNEIVDKLVIHQNFKIGMLNPIEVSGRSIVPYSARFRMGGVGLPYGEMLRGYSENMIGPIGSSYPKGGNIILKYSLELRYLLSENPNMYILCFAEAGNVWDKINIVDPFTLRRSMGVGVRVMMPMLGVLGYDAGYGFDSSVEEFLNGNNGSHGWEYHFIFGLPIN